MAHSPKFEQQLTKLRKIVINEMMAGCVDCVQANVLCREHEIAAVELWKHPKETLRKLGFKITRQGIEITK